MPSFDHFSTLVLKTTRPIKALLLDQAFSAGVGNWVAGNPFLLILHFTTFILFYVQTRFYITHAYTLSNPLKPSRTINSSPCIATSWTSVKKLSMSTPIITNFLTTGSSRTVGSVLQDLVSVIDWFISSQGKGKKAGKHSLKLVCPSLSSTLSS